MTSTSTEYYEVMSEPVIKLDAEGLAENVGMDEADTITIEDDGVYEIRYLVKVQEAEQTATMSVKVTRNGQPFEGDEPAKQIVGLTDSRSLPIPAVFEGHIVERLRRGDRLRLEQDAPCVVWLQQGRSASLYVRKID
jgi:hypothetical protein